MRRISCIVGEFPTGYTQEESEDLLDVPDFFSHTPARRLAELMAEDDPRPRITDPQEPPQLGAGGTFGGGGASGSFSTPSGLQVKTKPNVVLPRGQLMLAALRLAADRGDVITSGNDSRHLPNSLHYEDKAIDVRPAADWRSQQRQYQALGYKVLAEGLSTGITPGVGTGAHLHISIDPEGRRV